MLKLLLKLLFIWSKSSDYYELGGDDILLPHVRFEPLLSAQINAEIAMSVNDCRDNLNNEKSLYS